MRANQRLITKNSRYYNLFNRSKIASSSFQRKLFEIALLKLLQLRPLTSPVFNTSFPSLWYFFFILLNINCFLNKQKFTKKSFAISFEVFDNRFEHLYLKARWPRFVILTPPKYRCCVPSKKWIKFVVSANSFLSNQNNFGRKERRNLPGPFIWTLRSPISFTRISVTATCTALYYEGLLKSRTNFARAFACISTRYFSSENK